MRQKIFDENLDTPPSPLIHKLFRYRKFSETHRRMFQLRNFSAMWDKNFRRKILILHPPPSYPYTFSLPEIFWNTPPKGSSTKCFGTVRQKIFDRKSWHSPSPLIHKLFRCRKLSETQHRRVHLQNFSALWNKKLSTENLDTPPSPFLSIHFFAAGNFLKHSTEGFTYKIFRHCETKNFRRKILILPPPLLSINFFATGNFLKHTAECFNYEIFRQCETKIFRRKILIVPPPPSYPYTFSLPEIFWNTPPKGSSTKCFGTVRQKIFDGKSWYSPLPSYP